MSNKFATHIDLVEIPNDPSVPEGGFRRLYSKTDGKTYQRDANGVITELTNDSVEGDLPVFIQDATPSHSGKYLWVQTNIDGDPANFTIFFNS